MPNQALKQRYGRDAVFGLCHATCIYKRHAPSRDALRIQRWRVAIEDDLLSGSRTMPIECEYNLHWILPLMVINGAPSSTFALVCYFAS